MEHMSANGGHPTPTTRERDEALCGRCVRCHPGRAWGGDELCRVLPDIRPWVTCPCHRTDEH